MHSALTTYTLSSAVQPTNRSGSTAALWTRFASCSAKCKNRPAAYPKPPGGFLHPPLERMRGFDMRISTIITLSLVLARANVRYYVGKGGRLGSLSEGWTRVGERGAFIRHSQL